MSEERGASEKRKFAQFIDMLVPEQVKVYAVGNDLDIQLTNRWRFNGVLKNVQIEISYYVEQDAKPQ